MTEAELQRLVQLEASRLGLRLWRNNVGATTFCENVRNCPHATGRPIRYGLANESAAQNKGVKSADLIGITPVLIGPEHVGRVMGVFTSIEVKRPGWRFTGTDREQAQAQWADMIRQFGGISKIINSVEGLRG